MHTIPIAHWGGAAAPAGPLLTLDYRTPVAGIYPQSSAEVVALGLPAPTALFTMQELVGPIVDVVGGIPLTASGGGVGVQIGQRACGVYHGGSLTGGVKKAIEAVDDWDGLSAPTVNDFDVGLNSFALFFEYRLKKAFGGAGNRDLFCKPWNTSPYAGYHVYGSTSGIVIEIRDGIASQFFTKNFVAADNDSSWHRCLFILNRTTMLGQWITDRGNLAPTAVTRGDLTSDDLPFRVFGNPTIGAKAQISQLIMWIGASAELLGQPEFDILNVHGSDPNPVPLNVATHATVISDLCGYTAGFGVHLADWSVNKLPIGWNQKFNAGTGGLGLGVWRAATSLITYSDMFSDAAWTKSGTCTVSTASANLNNSPRGMLEAAKMTVAAGAGYTSMQTATVAVTRYTFDVFVKRHSTQGTDVNCNLEMFDATAGVSVATQVFVATAEWQRISLTAETRAGQIATQWRINITAAAGSIAINRATVVAGYLTAPIFSDAGVAGSLAVTDFRLTDAAPGNGPGVFQKGAQGEIEMTFAAVDGSNLVQRTTINEQSAALANRRNAHNCAIQNTDNAEQELYDNTGGGVWIASTYSPALNMDIEHVARYRWDITGLPSGNTLEDIYDGGAPVAGYGAAWAAGDTIDYFWFGQDETLARQFDGAIALLRIWGLPQ